MANKLNHDIIQHELNDKYNSFTFEFIKKDSDGLKFSCVCNKCKKEYIKHYYNIKSNFKCSNCNRINKSKDKFIKYIGDKYELISDFIDNDTIVQIKCNKCDDIVRYRPNDQYENRPIQCSCYRQAKKLENSNIKRNKSIDVIINKFDNIEYIDDVVKCKIHNTIIDVIYEPKYYQNITSNICHKCAATNETQQGMFCQLPDEHQQRDKSLIFPCEMDIVSHKHKLAVEYNELLQNSYGMNFPNNYRSIDSKSTITKTELIESTGYQLFIIWENEWFNPIKQKIWKSMINSKIGETERIFARKCEIKEISNYDYKEFINNNHMQGYRAAKVKLGLYYQDDIVACMSFGYPIFTKDIEYELIRFCNKINYTVIGGASKLFKYFERNYNPKNVVSYANRRWSQGHLYEQLKFALKNISEPNHFYFHASNIYKLYSRHKFQKHKLPVELRMYDPTLSAIDNIMNNGYRIIYDSGNYTYIWKKDTC